MYETALRVYGHQTVQMENDCYDSQTGSALSATRMPCVLRIPSTTFARREVTPIAYSLEQSIKGLW